MKIKTKILVLALVFTQVVSVPFLAFAATVTAVPTSVTTSIADDLAFHATFDPIVAANTACAKSEQAALVGNAAAQNGFSWMGIIGGSSASAVQLGSEVNQYALLMSCRQAVLTSLKAVASPNLYLDNQVQSLANQANNALQADQTKFNNYLAQLATAEQSFWKTLVFNILIQTSKSVADALVTKLVNNYKISNVKQYADSVATLMYDNQYLRDNFPDAQGQMMARTILTQPELRNQIQPGILVAANAALGFAPNTLSPSDPQFYQKMAMVGSSPANPYFLQTSYVSGVDQAHSQALIQANAQIAQSQGYKTPVNCSGSLAQQQQIDTQVKAAQDQMANRAALLASLQNAGKAANPSDLAKAQADYDNAVVAWQKLPYAVTGNSSVSNLSDGNNTEGTMAITMCEAISSPANLINKGIDQAFNAVGVNMAQYNNNNLPGFISLIGNVASQIGTSLIFGGTSAAQGAALANENRLLSGAVTAVNQTTANTAAATAANSITFIVAPSGSNTYQVTWSVDSTVYPTADHVSVVGDGIASTGTSFPISNSTTITTAKGGSYTLTVYDAKNNILGSRSISVNPNSGSASVAAAPVTGSITITPPSGTVSAGDNIFVTCSNLSVPSGDVIAVNVNNATVQILPIAGGLCSGVIAVSKANHFSSTNSNIINAWVGDASGSQITGMPDVTATLAVSGTVLGSFTNVPDLELRGPSLLFDPRGQ